MTTLNGRLLCAAGCAYGIDPVTGIYSADQIYSPAVGFLGPPQPFSSGGINACLAGRNADGIIVAFRGTLSPVPLTALSLRDWLQNFFEEPKAVASGALQVPGSVHSGFYDATASLIGSVAQYVRSLDPTLQTPVYVTGHSKGGALATIGTWLLRQSFGLSIRETVTFASPRVGDTAFKAAFEAVLSQTRFENYGDIVPLVPPSHAPFDLLTGIVQGIPVTGPQIADWFRAARNWDYRPVGSLAFIDSSDAHYQIRTDEQLEAQVLSILEEIGRDLLSSTYSSIADAHSLSCGYGYMHGVCPIGVCG